jgi:hypothetical protein
MLDLAEFDTPFFHRVTLGDVFGCLKEKQDRQDKEALWRSYVAMIVPMWGGENCPTFEDLYEKQERMGRVTTREEIAEAEEIGRETAAAFGLL